MAFSLDRLTRCFSSHFAEEVVYRPAKGLPRRIKAVVDRQSPVPIGESRPIQFLLIEVDNDPITGITADEIDTGRDRIEVARVVGGVPESRDIGQVVNQDEGRITMEVR
jgi:hypothetical protein